MTEKKEIQIAWEIWNLINSLNDLLWDRYENAFLEIDLQKEHEKFLSTIDDPSLIHGLNKTKPSE